MIKKPKNSAGMYIMLILSLVIMAVVLRMPSEYSTVKYSQILSYFEEQKVEGFTIDAGKSQLTLKLQKPDNNSDKNGNILYKVPSVDLLYAEVRDDIAAYNEANPDSPMVYDIIPATTNWFITLLPTLGSLLLMGGLFYFMMRQSGGGGGMMNVGKAKVKDQTETGRRATFADVAGADEEKAELEEIVEFLKTPGKFSTLGARIPRGVLLVGPPGTGKTLIARACAGEAGVPFYSISGSDFVEMYVGVGASRVRDLFDKAKKNAPCIIFIDEIDAVGRQRGTGLGGGHDEREQTLNQMLVEMDGFTANDGVIVIAATNRADILDRALLRPGRFDRQIYVGLPDVRGREQILRVHTRNKPMGPDINLSTIAKTTPGFTGADLENLVNEAALLAARRGKKAITQSEIEEASIKVVAGPAKKSRVVTEKERKLTAYHEGGHAIATYYSPTGDPVHTITIIPRGMAGGFTMSLPEKDVSFDTKRHMEDEIVILLGGRVAEHLVLDDISTGASNDLQRATAIARAMVTRYGFSDKLGPMVYGTDPSETFLGRDFSQGRNYSEEVASEIDAEMREFIEEAYAECTKLLSEHMEQLHVVANALLERETLSGSEFRTLMTGGTLPPLELDAPKEQPSEADEATATEVSEAAGQESPAAEPATELAAPADAEAPAAQPEETQDEENHDI